MSARAHYHLPELVALAFIRRSNAAAHSLHPAAITKFHLVGSLFLIALVSDHKFIVSSLRLGAHPLIGNVLTSSLLSLDHLLTVEHRISASLAELRLALF